MLSRKIITAYCENFIKYVNTLSAQNLEFLTLKPLMHIVPTNSFIGLKSSNSFKKNKIMISLQPLNVKGLIKTTN
jgi:hypothetical protein